MRFVELFAGIGGFSLGFERAGMECVGHVEIDKYAQKVLLKHWPNVPLFPDVREIKGDEFGKIDLLCGGFPCQDISIAGKQKGLKNEDGTATRSGLYDDIIRIAGVCRPRYIVLENVAALLSRTDWFGYVLGRLAEIGYDAEWEIIQACEFELPHARKRVFIVAYTKRSRLQKFCKYNKSFEKLNERVSDTCSANITAKGIYGQRDCFEIRRGNGVPSRVDRLKCLGNALVPQIAEWIGKKIIQAEH